MKTLLKILLVCLMAIQRVSSFATTSQECESPCVHGQACEVSCTAVSGPIVTGLLFFWNNNQIVGCVNQQCTASFPAFHNYTQINSTTASLQILNFNRTSSPGLYQCSDGSGGKKGYQVNEVMTADIPDGTLMGSADPALSERVTCSVTKAGTASLTLTAPNGTVLATNASSVLTADVGDVSPVTCSLEWPTCQKYINRKFPPVTVTITSSTTEPPVNGTDAMSTTVSATDMTSDASGGMSSVASTSSSPSSASTSAGSGTTDSGTSAYTSTVPSSNNPPSSTWSMPETSTLSISTEHSSSLPMTTVGPVAGGDGYMNSKLVGSIVGGIVGGFVFIVLFILMIIFCVRRRKRGNALETSKNVISRNGNTFDYNGQSDAARHTSHL